MHVIHCLLVRETTVDLYAGADPWEERRVQILQEEITVRDERLPRKVVREHEVRGINFNMHFGRIRSLVGDDHGVEVTVIPNIPCVFKHQ